MKLSVNIIFDNLSYEHRHIWDAGGDNCVIEDMMFLHEGLGACTADHLYVGPAEQLPPFQQIPANASFLCYGASSLDLRGAPPFNLILIEDSIQIFELFNTLQQIFTKFNLWQERLEAAIQREAPLQEFIDASAGIIGWPLSMIDVAQGTLAISDFNRSDDIIWSELQKGYIRTELCTQDSIQNEDISSQSGPVQMYSTISGRILLAQAVRVRNHTVGFVSAHRPTAGTEKFPRSTEQLINVLATAVSKRMGSSEFYQYSRGFILDCLIVDLIDRKITNADTIKDRLEFAKWEAAGDSRICVIRFRRCASEDAGLQCMLEQLESLLPQAKALFYHGDIILLQRVLRADSFAEHTDQRFLQWLQSHGAYCGISNLFSDYSQLADYYVQATKAARFGNALSPEADIHAYRDFIQEHMYETLGKTADLRLFIHPDVLRLMNYNKTKDYIYETLKCLIQNDFNIVNTSREMFIHKNTLSYRLHQIEEYAGFSLNDPVTRTMLTRSMDLLSYMVTFQHYNPDTDTYSAENADSE